MRYALYFTPPREHLLTRTASAWLGRDAFTGLSVPRPAISELADLDMADITAAPSRYGFHATLKAPFHLLPEVSESELIQAVAAFSSSEAPVGALRLKLDQIEGFIALVSAEPMPQLHRFADDVVTAFDRFRDRHAAGRPRGVLSPTEQRNLDRWGYPFVFEAFQFHMTLTSRLADAETPPAFSALRKLFEPILETPLSVNCLSLFVEPEPDAPFVVRSFHPLGRVEDGKTAG